MTTRTLVLLVVVALLGLSPFQPLAAGSPGRNRCPAPPAGSGHRVATWYAAPQDSTSTSRDQSYRMVVHTALGGSRVRLRFSNAYGRAPLTIRHVSLALKVGGVGGPAVDGDSVTPVRFGGRDAVVIPAGRDTRSDPVSFPLPADGTVAVSFHVPTPVARVTVHADALTVSWMSSAGSGNVTGDPTGSALTPTSSWWFLTGVEVLASRRSSTVVALGDSITDGAFQVSGTDRRWPDLLNDRIAASSVAGCRSVVNAGISGNMVTANRDGTAIQGEAAVRRVARDVLAQPSVSHVIIFEGINDIGEGVQARELVQGYRQLIAILHLHGITVIGATMTPSSDSVVFGPAYTTNAASREVANTWIRTSGAFDHVVDFSAAVALPTSPEMWNPAFTADFLHPNPLGMQVLADTLDLEDLR